jgi:transcriptional regulator with XRE-family HTH domain
MDLSERTGLSKGYLSKLEASRDGARNPSRATLVALARALPGFRPLAYTLEPTTALDNAANEAFGAADRATGDEARGPSLAFAEALPRPLALFIGRAEAAAAREAAGMSDADDADDEVETPIHLGWRELELLLALLALERSAVAHPLTARVIARAVDRPTESVAPLLERLTQAKVLRVAPPMRPGGAPTYAPGPALAARVGLSRVGDALTLAAALLAQGPLQQTISQSQVRAPGRPKRAGGG